MWSLSGKVDGISVIALCGAMVPLEVYMSVLVVPVLTPHRRVHFLSFISM